MEPITTTIVTALAAGDAAAGKETASAAIKDAYQGLKSLIQRRFAGTPNSDVVLAEHEKEPDTWQKPMEKALTESGADTEDAVVRQAEALLKLLADGRPGSPRVRGSGAAADRGGIAAGRGGIAAGGNVSIGQRARPEDP
ncbi:MAG: hypothetical protein ACOYXR_14030 [Nitrospirota bacterium]